MRARIRPVLALLACGAVVACARDQAAATGPVERETIDGVTWVRNPDRPAADASVRLEWIIGQDLGDSTQEFAQIWDLEIGPEGGVYVLDTGLKRVSLFDATGTFRRRFGRSGQGPGEFQWPTRLTAVDADIGVWDMMSRRLTVFSGDDGGYLNDYSGDQWGLIQVAAWSGGRIILQEGPSSGWPPNPEKDGVGTVTRQGLSDGSTIDTVFQFSNSASVVSVRQPGRSAGAGVPFGPVDRWSSSPSGVICRARGEVYQVDCYGADGKLFRVITRVFEAPGLADVERDSADRYVLSLGEEFQGLMRVPDKKPATGGILLAPNGRLFVRTFTANDFETQQWDIFDCSGSYVAAMVLPARLRSLIVDETVVHGVSRDELGVSHVERYSYAIRPEPAC